jgi:hypothetical protein
MSIIMAHSPDDPPKNQLAGLLGVENDRYMLQPLFTYNVDQGQLEATPARAGWEERIRRGLTHG